VRCTGTSLYLQGRALLYRANLCKDCNQVLQACGIGCATDVMSSMRLSKANDTTRLYRLRSLHKAGICIPFQHILINFAFLCQAFV